MTENSPVKQNELSVDSIVVAVKHHVASDLDGEAVILNLQSGVYYGLNQVSAYIWNLVQKPAIVGDVMVSLMEEYDVEAERCKSDLLTLLRDLQQADLIEIINNQSAE